MLSVAHTYHLNLEPVAASTTVTSAWPCSTPCQSHLSLLLPSSLPSISLLFWHSFPTPPEGVCYLYLGQAGLPSPSVPPERVSQDISPRSEHW